MLKIQTTGIANDEPCRAVAPHLASPPAVHRGVCARENAHRHAAGALDGSATCAAQAHERQRIERSAGPLVNVHHRTSIARRQDAELARCIPCIRRLVLRGRRAHDGKLCANPLVLRKGVRFLVDEHVPPEVRERREWYGGLRRTLWHDARILRRCHGGAAPKE